METADGEKNMLPLRFVSVMADHPEDVRWSYIKPLDDGNGGIATKNGIEIYYVTKFSFQDGSPNLSSPDHVPDSRNVPEPG